MPSSTFSSEVVEPQTRPAARGSMSARAGIISLLAGLVVIFLGLELSSPLILERLSHTAQRIGVEMQATRHLRP